MSFKFLVLLRIQKDIHVIWYSQKTIIILHCLHFDSKLANIYKFKHLFGNLLHVCGVAVKPLYS